MKNVEVHAALGKRDNEVLTLDFQSSWSQDNTDTLKYMYGKGDYEKLRKMISGTDWEEQLDGKTVDQAWTTVRSPLEAEAIDSCTPKKTTRPVDALSRKPWNTSVTIGKVKRKSIMYRRWMNSTYPKGARSATRATTLHSIPHVSGNGDAARGLENCSNNPNFQERTSMQAG